MKLLIVPNYATARSLPGVRVDRRHGIARWYTEDGYLVLSVRSIKNGAARGHAFSLVVVHLLAVGFDPADLLSELMPALIAGGGA